VIKIYYRNVSVRLARIEYVWYVAGASTNADIIICTLLNHRRSSLHVQEIGSKKGGVDNIYRISRVNGDSF